MSAIQGTIRFVNPTKKSEKTGKWSQSIKVAVPGGQGVLIYGASGAFDTYKPNEQIMIEQDGQYWRIAKDQSGLSVTAPGATAPMSATPATVTNGQGYTATAHGCDHATMKERAANITAIALQIANEVRNSPIFKTAEDSVIASMTATILIQTRP